MAGIQINLATIAAAKARAIPGAKQYDVLDSRVEGLRLRVGARGVRWQLRFRFQGTSPRLDLGDVDEWKVKEVLDLAVDAKRLARSGTLPDDAWVDAQRVSHGKKDAPPAPIVGGLWTWEEAKAAFIESTLRTKKPATHVDYRNMLRAPELDQFAGRQVTSITLEEMAMAVEAVHRRGVERHAEHLASVVRPMWAFLGAPARRTLSGVMPGVMKELVAPERSTRTDGTAKRKVLYVPPMLEVGRIVAICRSDAIHPLIAAAIELTVFAAQRVTPVAAALKDSFNEFEDYECLWAIPAPHRKTAQRRGDESDHVLPLPPAAFAAAMKAVKWCAANGDDRIQQSIRVFPQLRSGKATNPPTIRSHLSQSTIGHTMGYMPGVKATPHDLRRALGTHGQVDLKMKKPETKIILDHLEGEKSGDVTEASYSLHHRLAEKWALLEPWAAHVEAHVVKALEADPRLTDVKWLKRQMQIAQDIAKNMKPRHPSVRGLIKAVGANNIADLVDD